MVRCLQQMLQFYTKKVWSSICKQSQVNNVDKCKGPTIFDVAHIMELKHHGQIILDEHHKHWKDAKAELRAWEKVYQDYQEQLQLLSPEKRPEYHHILEKAYAEVEMRRRRARSIQIMAQKENACRVLFHQLEVKHA